MWWYRRVIYPVCSLICTITQNSYSVVRCTLDDFVVRFTTWYSVLSHAYPLLTIRRAVHPMWYSVEQYTLRRIPSYNTPHVIFRRQHTSCGILLYNTPGVIFDYLYTVCNIPSYDTPYVIFHCKIHPTRYSVGNTPYTIFCRQYTLHDILWAINPMWYSVVRYTLCDTPS